MPNSSGGRLTFLYRAPRIVVLPLALLLSCAARGHSPVHKHLVTGGASSRAYDAALRLREELEAVPPRQRTPARYERVEAAFRAVYQAGSRGTHGDDSMEAVAELLAEQGHMFHDAQASRGAVIEYEHLRRTYPGSRYRDGALLAEGEIYRRDLRDGPAAGILFAQFLKLYPESPLAAEARAGLREVRSGRVRQASPGVGESHLPAARVAAVPEQEPRPAEAHAASQENYSRSIARPRVRSEAGLGTRQAVASTPANDGSGQPASGAKNAGQITAAAASSRGTRSVAPAPKNTLVERDVPATGAIMASGNQPADTSEDGEAPSGAKAEEHDAGSLMAQRKASLERHGGRLPMVTGVRHWSTSVYTRVAIDLGGEDVTYEASRVPNPDRIFFDLHGARLSPELMGKAVTVTDGGYLKRIRAAQYGNDVVRVVLDVSDVSEYSAFLLPNPERLIIDIHGKAGGAPAPVGSTSVLVASANSADSRSGKGAGRPVPIYRTGPGGQAPGVRSAGQGRAGSELPGQSLSQTVAASDAETDESSGAAATRKTGSGRTGPASVEALGEIATLDRQPMAVKATRQPTSAPVAASVADTTPAPQPGNVLAPAPDLTQHRTAKVPGTVVAAATRAHGVTAEDTPAPGVHAGEGAADKPGEAAEFHAAEPTAAGERSMVRALGLKIGRIVVDAGHGGHDSGTLGPGGIEEKNVVLDVSLRLGRLLKQRLGADVIYTRDDDTFIPLETRTAIANKAQADLFISVHANSSRDETARGVETYYLNFTSSADALETAARENAVSDESIHQLSDLVKKITLSDKIAESREFAGDVEGSLYSGLEAGNPGLKDRGVKKAPFVVLIGANMPSILAEISFLTNPDDAHQLEDPAYRERIAESLYKGVAKYISSLSGVRLAQGAGRPAGQ